MKKLSRPSYKSLFFKHLKAFISHADADLVNRPVCVAVSGGIDSMTLLWVARELSRDHFIGRVRAVFIHHQTRAGQDDEEKLVESFCLKNHIPLKVFRLEGLSGQDSNFEAKARKLRHSALLDQLESGERLWMGHHIDDSYEWSLMQKLRSGALKSSLGIAVKSGAIFRPFLCVTKAQIELLAKREKIPFLTDPTNFDLHHERNFLRSEIVPRMKLRYPKFLKFYALRSNQEARLLGVSVFRNSEVIKIHPFKNAVAFEGSHFSEEDILPWIHHFSHKNRGKISTPVLSMLKAIENGKQGPFHFSGDVLASFTPGLLIMTSKSFINADALIAEKLTDYKSDESLPIKEVTLPELKELWKQFMHSQRSEIFLPGPVILFGHKGVNKALNSSRTLIGFPELSRVSKEKNWDIIPIKKLIDTWEQKKEKLPNRLRLIMISEMF